MGIAAEASGHRRRAEEIDLGLCQRQSTLELYEWIFKQLLGKCQAETATRRNRKCGFKNKPVSLDGSIIE